MTTSDRTAAAIAARRQRTATLLTQVKRAIGQIQREQARVTIRAVARRAGVSTTFLYENPEARALVNAGASGAVERRGQRADAEHDRIELAWRERALNAEHALGTAQKEILSQRRQIADLMGQLRDLDQPWSGESVHRLLADKTALQQRVHQLAQEHRALQERLDAARSNNRFLDRRVADLEAQLAAIPVRDGQ